jgi:hypothetical protein
VGRKNYLALLGVVLQQRKDCTSSRSPTKACDHVVSYMLCHLAGINCTEETDLAQDMITELLVTTVLRFFGVELWRIASSLQLSL